jgi:hypothetical protein
MSIRLRYAVVGLFLGEAWVVHGGLPIWELALRLLALMFVVMPLVHLLRICLRRRRGVRGGPHLSLVRLAVVKLVRSRWRCSPVCSWTAASQAPGT